MEVDVPTGTDVLQFLGWPTTNEALTEQADRHAEEAFRLVRAYTRGRGILGEMCEEPIRSVILSFAGRSLANPTSAREIEAGSFRESPGSPWSLSLLETLTLNNFRRMAG